MVWISVGLATIAGAIVGSFLATVIIRWPDGEGFVSGRSRCDRCGVTLPAKALIPVFSFLALRGRCRRCQAPIGRVHLAVELAAAAIGALALGIHSATPPLGLALAMFGWLLLVLAALDWQHFWLPDQLVWLTAAAGLAANGLYVGPAPDFMASMIGLAGGYLSLALVALAYRTIRGQDGLGGGDPKLFAAIGAWLGWAALPSVLAGAALLGLGGVVAMFAIGHRPTAQTRLPFGTLLAIAAWGYALLV